MGLPTSSSASFIINKKAFTPQVIAAVQRITHKQSQTNTLVTLSTEEAAAHAEKVKQSTTSRDLETQAEEDSYDGDESDAEDGGMISNEVKEDATKMALKPTDQDIPPDGEVGEEYGANPIKEPDSKAPGNEHVNRSTSGPHDGPISYDRDVLAEGHVV